MDPMAVAPYWELFGLNAIPCHWNRCKLPSIVKELSPPTTLWFKGSAPPVHIAQVGWLLKPQGNLPCSRHLRHRWDTPPLRLTLVTQVGLQTPAGNCCRPLTRHRIALRRHGGLPHRYLFKLKHVPSSITCRSSTVQVIGPPLQQECPLPQKFAFVVNLFHRLGLDVRK